MQDSYIVTGIYGASIRKACMENLVKEIERLMDIYRAKVEANKLEDIEFT